jgi:hypothetical protein
MLQRHKQVAVESAQAGAGNVQRHVDVGDRQVWRGDDRLRVYQPGRIAVRYGSVDAGEIVTKHLGARDGGRHQQGDNQQLGIFEHTNLAG